MSNDGASSYDVHSEDECMAACSARRDCQVATFGPGNASLGKSVCWVSPTCMDISVHEEGFKLFIKGQTCFTCVGDVRGCVDVALEAQTRVRFMIAPVFMYCCYRENNSSFVGLSSASFLPHNA